MSLSSPIPGGQGHNGINPLYTSNPTQNNSNFFGPNNNNNHYHQDNQFPQPIGPELEGSQVLSSNLLPEFNWTKQPETLHSDPKSYENFNLLSLLFADSKGSSTTSFPTLVDPSYTDYDVISAAGDDSVQDAFVEGSHLWSLLSGLYGLVFIVGVIMNTVLLAALCGTGSRARALPVRNHLMVNLAAADLLVTAVCVPISACAAASHACWPSFLVSWMCQLGPLLQRTPVCASTLSLALLSLDRWIGIRHPRIAQRFRERRFVAMSMAIIWILASLVAAPTFWARQWEVHSSSLWGHTHSGNENHFDETGTGSSDGPGQTNSSTFGQEFGGKSGVCVERWTNIGVHLTYAATYLGTAFVSPALIVAACHASVSHKLTTQLKVLSGATSGDRFINKKPKQVLIVARDPSNNIIPNPLSPPVNNPYGLGSHPKVHGAGSRSGSIDCPTRPSRKFVTCDPNSDDDEDIFIRMQIENDLESLRQATEYNQQKNLSKSGAGGRRGVKSLATFRSEASPSTADNNNMLKAAKRETSIIRAHRQLRKKLNVPLGIPVSTKLSPAALLPTYSSQSFRSRRRAARLLATLAAVFVSCWLPYVICATLEMFLKEKSLVRMIIPFSLFLGHAHSAINPVVSWRLNRSAFVRFQKQSILSFLPEWLRTFSTFSRLFCYSCTCPPPTCCDKAGEEEEGPHSPSPAGRGQGQGQGEGQRVRPPLRRAGTRYPGINETRNPFLNASPRGRDRRNRDSGDEEGRRGPSSCFMCMCGGDETEDAVPCCCCFCPGGMFARRSSSPDLWNRNTSTNEAALGAFHPKYLNRLPVDPVSRCHTSHFLK